MCSGLLVSSCVFCMAVTKVWASAELPQLASGFLQISTNVNIKYGSWMIMMMNL